MRAQLQRGAAGGESVGFFDEKNQGPGANLGNSTTVSVDYPPPAQNTQLRQ